MSRKQMYFGTRDRMAWVACPAVERDSGAVGWSESGTYLNGGAFVARSKGSHRVHEMAWNMISRKEAGKIESFASGVYGDGPYYWIDPMAADHNVLPTNWAYPAQELDTGVPLTDSTLGTFVATPAGNDSLPVRSIQYVLPTGSVGKKLWVPIPPGHTLHFGAYGSTSGSGTVFAVPYGRNGSVRTRTPTQLADPSGNVWATSSWSGDVYAGVEFDVGSSGTPMRNLVTNPRMVATSGTVEVRRNLAPNPAMVDTESTPEGLAVTNVHAPTTGIANRAMQTTEGLPVGEFAARYTLLRGTGGTLPVTTLSTTVGSTYSLKVLLRASKDMALVRLRLADSNSDYFDLPEGEWVEVSHSGVSNNAHSATVGVLLSSQGGHGDGDTLDIRKVLVEETSEVRPYFDGSTPSSDPDLTASWEGAENASESVLTGERVENVNAPTADQVAPAFRATGGPEGATHYARFRVLRTGAVAFPTGRVYPPTGELMTLLAWIRAPRDYTMVQMRISGATSERFDLPANEWVQKRVTMEAGTQPSSPVATGFRFENNGGHEPGDLIDVALVMLTPGEYHGDYRDGDSPGWAWEGAANASASTEVGAAVTLSGMVAQVLPNGRTPQATGWLDGLGTSGAEFEEFPERVDYSSILDKVGLTATMVEVGTWL